MKKVLMVKNLRVSTADKELVHGVDLSINEGETVVILGPNGAGKSTIARALMGLDYNTSGAIVFCDEPINTLSIEERSRKGIFLSYQDPVEIPGLSISEMLRTALENHGKKVSLGNFRLLLAENLDKLGLSQFIAKRDLNVDFSGGEKKKLEVVQMLTLKPKLAILDELDSGLDTDAAKKVSSVLAEYQKESKVGYLIITHNMRILSKLNVSKVYIVKDGEIVFAGNKETLDEVKKNGFANF